MSFHTPKLEFGKNFAEHLQAGYQILFVSTAEEARAETEIRAAAATRKMHTVLWDQVTGFSLPPEPEEEETSGRRRAPERRASPFEPLITEKGFKDPVRAIMALTNPEILKGNNANAAFVFRDLDDHFANPMVVRALRTLAEGNALNNERIHRPIVIITPGLRIHPKLKSCVTMLEFDLPDASQLMLTFEFIRSSVAKVDEQKAKCPDELREQIIDALRGLTSTEAENCLARCMIKHATFSADMLRTIKDEKAAVIRKSEVLTYIDETLIAPRNQIGGFDNLFEFIDRRKLAYTKEAQDIKLDLPKGIVLVGVPGTAKSVGAETIGHILNLPVYVMDVGAIFGSLVGESEARMRDVIRQIEAQQGCVLLIDEADKALGHATSSSGDSGVTRRVFGQLLSWLARKQDRTFVIVTMNRTDGMPPEFFRSGRFDAVFYTDLPGPQAREEILKIHLRKRGIDPADLKLDKASWAKLVDITDTFVGSELEATVVEARALAFEQRQSIHPNYAEFVEAANGTIPLATLDPDGVNAIRKFCESRAKPVGSPYAPKTAGVPSRHLGV